MDCDYSKLRGRIVEKLGESQVLAEKTGISRTSISLKLTGKLDFRQDEMYKICDALDISYDEIGKYFFTRKDRNFEQTE